MNEAKVLQPRAFGFINFVDSMVYAYNYYVVNVVLLLLHNYILYIHIHTCILFYLYYHVSKFSDS